MEMKNLNKNQWMNINWFEDKENRNSILKASEEYMMTCVKILMIDVCVYYDLELEECYSMMASNKFDYIVSLYIDHVGIMINWDENDKK